MRVDQDRLLRACAISGALWTTLGSLVLAAELNAALGGRVPFVNAFGAGGAIRHGVVVFLVIGGGLLWAATCAKLKSDAPSIEGYRRLQYVTMPIALVFLGVHAWLTWAPAMLGSDAGTVYEGLRRALPFYAMIGVYVVGLAALGLATEQALLVWVAVTGTVSRPATLRWFRVSAALLPLVLVVVAFNGVSHFVTGRGVFWRPDPTELAEPADIPAERPRGRERLDPVGNPEGDPIPRLDPERAQ